MTTYPEQEVKANEKHEENKIVEFKSKKEKTNKNQ